MYINALKSAMKSISSSSSRLPTEISDLLNVDASTFERDLLNVMELTSTDNQGFREPLHFSAVSRSIDNLHTYIERAGFRIINCDSAAASDCVRIPDLEASAHEELAALVAMPDKIEIAKIVHDSMPLAASYIFSCNGILIAMSARHSEDPLWAKLTAVAVIVSRIQAVSITMSEQMSMHVLQIAKPIQPISLPGPGISSAQLTWRAQALPGTVPQRVIYSTSAAQFLKTLQSMCDIALHGV